jgi:hypothetical protein
MQALATKRASADELQEIRRLLEDGSHTNDDSRREGSDERD